MNLIFFTMLPNGRHHFLVNRIPELHRQSFVTAIGSQRESFMTLPSPNFYLGLNTTPTPSMGVSALPISSNF